MIYLRKWDYKTDMGTVKVTLVEVSDYDMMQELYRFTKWQT